MDEERRVALKFAYDGTKFFGFQRQPDKVTVEGTLVRALEKVGAITSSRGCGYRSSSRTDRGVSALGNIVSFTTQFDKDDLCPALNSEMEDIWAYSAIEVPASFNPRAARERWYRYFLPRAKQDIGLMREIAKSYIGVHDFSGHARKDKRNPMREIRSIEIAEEGIFYVVDFRAESFLWNMVRRIVWMLNEGSSGRIPVASTGPEPREKPIRIGLARPEYLVLMDIDCGIDFRVNPRVVRSLVSTLNRRIVDASMNLMLAEETAMRITGHRQPSQIIL